MDIEDIIKSPDSKLNEEQISIIRNELIKNDFDSTFEFIKNIRKTFKINCSKIDLIYIYNSLGYEDYNLKKKLIKKIQKSLES